MKGFAVTENRESKARKIEKVICHFLGCEELSGKNILDIGAGSGHIAEFFSQRNKVWGVDATLQLKDNSGFFEDFRIVKDEALPFADCSFDIVLSNHIAAYLPNKNLHFQEIQRVLKPGGLCYFATPNRNFPLDPHFKVPFLHYFPDKQFNFLMHVLGKFKEPVYLQSLQNALQLAQKHLLRPVDYSVPIIRNPKQFHMSSRAIPRAPGLFKWISPTIVLILEKKY